MPNTAENFSADTEHAAHVPSKGSPRPLSCIAVMMKGGLKDSGKELKTHPNDLFYIFGMMEVLIEICTLEEWLYSTDEVKR